MMHIRYKGEFLSRAGVRWRAEIHQKADTPFATVGELTFEAEEALTIEWPEKSKETVVCGSSATLRLESPGDRTYADLYSVKTRQVRLDLYRNNALYWSGCLDPEFYEEPYEREKFYTVSLTFSDFGVLSRLKYNLTGMRTLSQILYHCLGQSAINFGGVDQSMISTRLPGAGRNIDLSYISVRSDNFYDEEGEASSLEEVLTGIFQPLGLRMIQRCGSIYIYDLNGLYNTPQTAVAVWSGDSSTMGTDNVYNNVKITYSPYAQVGNLAPEGCWDEGKNTPVNKHKLLYGDDLDAATDPETGSEYVSYFLSTDVKDWADNTDLGFTMWTDQAGEGAGIDAEAGVRFFKVVPQNDGSDEQGVAINWPHAAYKPLRGEIPDINWTLKGVEQTPFAVFANQDCGSVLFRSKRVWLPPVGETTSHLINITLEFLCDPRINIYESAENMGESESCAAKDKVETWKRRGNFIYIPVTIKFKPDNSDIVYVWDNSAVCSRANNDPVRSVDESLGRWVRFTGTDDAPTHWGWLCYYDPFDRKESCGVAQGWTANRQAINPHNKPLVTSIQQLSDGQRIPYPTLAMGSGEIWVEVRRGWRIRMAGSKFAEADFWNIKAFQITQNGGYKWGAFKLPKIEVVNNSWFDTEIKNEDVEYSAEINPDAKDGIDLSTICGTAKEGVTLARGAYFAHGNQVTAFERAGRTEVAEELLIGTIYSQYADRRTKLSGEIELHPTGFAPYTEQNQQGKRFILVGETQDVISDTTQATITELRPDEYTKDNG